MMGTDSADAWCEDTMSFSELQAETIRMEKWLDEMGFTGVGIRNAIERVFLRGDSPPERENYFFPFRANLRLEGISGSKGKHVEDIHRNTAVCFRDDFNLTTKLQREALEALSLIFVQQITLIRQSKTIDELAEKCNNFLSLISYLKRKGIQMNTDLEGNLIRNLPEPDTVFSGDLVKIRECLDILINLMLWRRLEIIISAEVLGDAVSEGIKRVAINYGLIHEEEIESHTSINYNSLRIRLMQKFGVTNASNSIFIVPHEMSPQARWLAGVCMKLLIPLNRNRMETATG